MSIVGDWKLTLKTPFGTETPTLRIKPNHSVTIEAPRKVELSEIKVSENAIEYTAKTATLMGKFSIRFQAEVVDDVLTGTFASPLGPVPFKGVRLG